ncbi:hypothetical protein [uncultured Intestinimonas sp.]|uniref:hypothetical protein n=1 Tax=uncultured Intestinimonas sp. TaxID=1689265 RepID=UPI00261339E7|nr:hypothetical protein [uncultured Intestinimonas sp.]
MQHPNTIDANSAQRQIEVQGGGFQTGLLAGGAFAPYERFRRRRKPWRRANSLRPSIQIPKGGGGLWPPEGKKKDTTYVVSFFLEYRNSIEPLCQILFCRIQ